MPFNEDNPLLSPPSVHSPSSMPPGPAHMQGQRNDKSDLRNEARRARVVALLQEAVNEDCFGTPDYAKGEKPIEVTGEHADAVAALLTRRRNRDRDNLPNPEDDDSRR